MLHPLLLSAVAVVATAQITSVKISIQTQGVFRSTNDQTSTTGIWFNRTSSFEMLNPDEEQTTAIYNLGAFNGTPSGTHDQFRLTLYQSINGRPPAYIGEWTGHLDHGTVRFDHSPLRYCDDEHVYVWRLTQHEFALGDFTPVNATATIETSSEPD
ncbi:MAG: hypothetical protein ACJ74Y_15705 [Bryobacteraceae bacterium]